MSRRITGALCVVLAIAGLYGTIVVLRAHSGLHTGQDLLDHQLWPQAREHFVRYLWLHPNDARVRMLMAEALVKDEALPSDETASQAVSYLAKISDDSPLAAEARLQQGRLSFLILEKPGHAEQLLRQSIELGTNDLPAYQLLWTLLNVTGRSEWAEEVFWHVYELSPKNERPLRLREWYMQQFFPTMANEPLDRMMGILAPGETATRTTESRRYLRFREREPEAHSNHAALAQWFQEERDSSFADRVLDAAAVKLPSSQVDPFFLAVTIAVQLDLGQFDEAVCSFRRWPAENRGYEYWKLRAILLDDATNQYGAAIEAYDHALTLWPGPVEWSLHFRRASCLTHLRRPQEAAAARRQAEEVQALLTPEVHQRLREVLGDLDDPEKLAEIVRFYKQLGRDREARCWDEYIQNLQGTGGKRTHGNTVLSTPEKATSQ